MRRLTIDDKERFMRIIMPVMRTGDDCWVWPRGTSVGYGRFKSSAGVVGAHVASAQAHGYYINDGELIRHLCHNRACVNPIHLCPGSHAENMRDMVEAGRQATGDRHGTKTHPGSIKRGESHHAKITPWVYLRGESHPKAKLNWSSVDTIRALYAGGGHSQNKLAAMFGVSSRCIHFIVHNKHWRKS